MLINVPTQKKYREKNSLQFCPLLSSSPLPSFIKGKSGGVDDFQVKELERQMKKEKERSDKLEKDVAVLKAEVEKHQKAASEAEDSQTAFLDQIEELTYKLTQAESKTKQFEAARVEDGVKVSHKEFFNKNLVVIKSYKNTIHFCYFCCH